MVNTILVCPLLNSSLLILGDSYMKVVAGILIGLALLSVATVATLCFVAVQHFRKTGIFRLDEEALIEGVPGRYMLGGMFIVNSIKGRTLCV